MTDDNEFGALLRRHRVARTLTQEGLAELAGMSAAAIAALEAGRRRAPRLSTIANLAGALGLSDEQRAELAATAVPGASAADGAPARTERGPTARFTGALELPGVLRRFAFVGRDAERAALDSAWERTVRVVLVSGEAGAGKTRLIGEFALDVGLAASVLWGRCTPERLGAYEPFVDPVRRALESHDAGSLTGELQRIVPELPAGSSSSGGAGPSIAIPGVERRLFFDAVVELLRAHGRALLVIDDVQWADAGSLALLAHLAASDVLGELTIVGAIRSTDIDAATSAALSELRRQASLERITVAGLSGESVHDLVRSVAGGEVTSELVATVAAATDGNPLFIAELTEHLLAQHWTPSAADPISGAVVPVPVAVQETLTNRVLALSEASRSLVRAGAVLGRTFDTAIAAHLANLDADAELQAVEDALDGGLVTEVSARALAFTHALVHAAVYESMTARRRLDSHRRAARLLEELKDDDHIDDAMVYSIARHWAIVARDDRSAVDDAVRWTLRAGDAAAEAADISEAIRRYEWAAAHWLDPTRGRAEVLLKLGQAYNARSETAAADEQFWAALALAETLDDPRLYADAAIGLAATVRFGRHDAARIDALEQAMGALPDDEYVRRITAASMLKRQLGFDDSDEAYPRRQAAAAIVLAAVGAQEPPSELLVSLGAQRDTIIVDDPVVLDRVSTKMIHIARDARNLPMLANAWYGKAWAAFELADASAWHEAAAAFTEVAQELALPFELALAARMDAATALMEGRYVDGEREAERALALAADADPNAPAIHLVATVLRGVDCGIAAETTAFMLALRDDLASVPTFMAGLAMAAAFGGAPGVAREILAGHAEVAYADVRRDLEWLPVIGLLCHTCVQLAERDYAEVMYDQLSSHPALAVRIGPLGAFWGPTDYHLGALCRLLARRDESELRLRRAIVTCTELGARPWLARTQLELAALLVEGSAPGSPEIAALRDAARTTAVALGAHGILALLE